MPVLGTDPSEELACYPPGSFQATAAPSIRANGITESNNPVVTVPETDVQRLLNAAWLGVQYLPEDARASIAPLLNRKTVLIIAGSILVGTLAQGTPVGWALDVIGGAVLYVTIGWAFVKALKGFSQYYSLAVHAQSDEDLDAAGKAFADAWLNLVTAYGLYKINRWLGQSKAGRSAAVAATQDLAEWESYINALKFKVPRNRGMLWSKIRLETEVPKIANREDLVWLEKILEKNGFMQRYRMSFKPFEQLTEAEKVITKQIWTKVSSKFVQSLEGDVTAYVRRAKYFQSIEQNAVAVAQKQGLNVTWDKVAGKAIGPDVDELYQFKLADNPANDPVLVTETRELTELLKSNQRITGIRIVDVDTGEDFGCRTRELWEAFERMEKRAPSLSKPFDPGSPIPQNQ